MARRFSGSYKNPYLKDVEVSEEASYQLDVLLDEARTRRVGTIKSKKGVFEIQRAKLLSKSKNAMKPDSARFDLDVEEDLNSGRLTSEMLEKMSYSPSYRPSGKVGEQISDFTISRLRYSALAGRKARAPKDLYFLKDPAARDKFEEKKERDGKLRRSTVRNEIPIEKRRAELIEMLPKEQQEKYEDIAREVNEFREKRDIAQGKAAPRKEHKKRYDDEDFSRLADMMEIDDPTEDFRRRELGEEDREDKLPEQHGMIDSERPLPQLYSETRHWSRIDSENPTWSEIQQNTETVVYGVKKETAPSPANHGRYISDEDFDPNNRYKQQSGVAPRRMPKLESYDDMKAISINPYTSDCVLSPDQIEEIMKDNFRSPGQLSLPDEITDPKLRGVWYGTYGAKYRQQDEQAMREAMELQMAQQAQHRRRKAPNPARKGNAPRVHYADRPSAYREPIAQGYALGQIEADRFRDEEARRKKIIEENEKRLAAEKQRKTMEEQRKADAQRWAKEQEEYRKRMSGQMPPNMQRPAQAPTPNHMPNQIPNMQRPMPNQAPNNAPQNRGPQTPPTTKRWDMQEQAAKAWQMHQAQYDMRRQEQRPPEQRQRIPEQRQPERSRAPRRKG